MLEPTIPEKRWWHREDILLLLMLGALLLLPGLNRIPLFDRDEPRFATAARNMLTTGDYIVPRFNGMLRPDKPPLVYWLMDLGYIVTGGPGELGARLPSAVCGTVTLVVIYFMVGSRFGRLTGFVAALIFGTCALFLVEGRMATADGTMLLGIVLSMACAWQAWDAGGAPAGGGGGTLPRADYLLDRSAVADEDGRPGLMLDHLPMAQRRRMSWGMALLFWLGLAFGTLAKGVPLAFVLVPMVVLSLCTGALPVQLARWRSHFRFTRGRLASAVIIIGGVCAFTVVSYSTGMFAELRLWVALLGLLLLGMLVTPGLPAVLGRCLFHGNWSWWRQLRPAVGVPLLVVAVGWWVMLAGEATHWQLIRDMVGTHFLNRIGLPTPDTTPGGTQDPMKAYGKPPGFYLLLVWGTFWPWSVLLVPMAFHAWRRLRGRTAIAIDVKPYQFLLAWIVPMWILLELSRGKLMHYPLPLYVPLAILCADTLVQSWNRLTDVLAAPWFAGARWVMLVIWMVLGGAVLAGARLAPDQEFFWKCFPFGVALIATGLAGSFTWGKPSWPYVVALCWGGSLMLASTMILPEMPELQVSQIAGSAMGKLKSEAPARQLAVCGYEEATLVFYSGYPVKRFDSVSELIRSVPFERRGWRRVWPVASPARDVWVIAVEESVRRQLDGARVVYYQMPRPAQFDLPAHLQAYRIEGFNTGNMRPVTVTVISNQVAKPEPAEGSRAGSDASGPAQ